jgi:hypothetical protein
MPMFPRWFPNLQAARDFVAEEIMALLNAGAETIIIAEEGLGSDRYLAKDLAEKIAVYTFFEWEMANADWS